MREIVAVVEDDPDILKLVTVTMERAGLAVRGFGNGAAFLTDLAATRPDLVILDLMLPDLDGMDICRRLRQNAGSAALPILILTARGEETDKVVGLEMGADDYVTKPFSTRELLARVRALLRRAHPAQPAENGQALRIGTDLEIFPGAFETRVSGRKVDLTATEFKLLHILASAPGRVFSRDQILDRLWGSEKTVVDRTIDVHVKNLREKLGPAGRHIKAFRGVGYKIEE